MSEQIPETIVGMLEKARFLHLGTSKNDIPSVSLMNFTLLTGEDSFKKHKLPVVVLATHTNTQKFENIQANPNVSLLVHDFMASSSGQSSGIKSFLENLNQGELAHSSATLAGTARIATGDEAEYYREQHLAKHPDAACFIANSEIVLVDLHSAKLADSTNHVQEFR